MPGSPTKSDRGSAFGFFPAVVLLLALQSGCSVPLPPPAEHLSPLEQVLIGEAAERGAKELYASIPEGATVAIETFGLTSHHPYMQGVVAGWLGRKGVLISRDRERSKYLIRVIVQALGTEKGERTFGTQEVQSALLPVGLPPLTLFNRKATRGYARFYMDVYENATGRMVHSTPLFTGTTYHNRYTFLFFITISSTDLNDAP